MRLSRIWLGAGAAAATLAAMGCGRIDAQAQASRDVLLEGIHAGVAIEQYVAQIVAVLRSADRAGDGLDKEDVALQRDIQRAQARGSAIGSMLSRDLDGDFKVTRDELERSARGVDQYRDREIARLLGQSDTDGDGTITLPEMAASARDPVRENRLADLLALDPDRDGRLTAEELRKLAEQSFATVDGDRDGKISREEFAPVAERIRAIQMAASAPRCDLPAVASGTRLVVYSGYEGSALSSVAVGGLDQETNVIDVLIEPGTQPLYLVLSSYESMVWRLKGHVARVERVVVSANGQGGGGVSPAGVTGVPAARVTIAPQGCPPYASERDFKRTEASVRRSLGRDPDAVFGSYSAQEVRLPSGTTVPATRGAAPVPAGFDAGMWAEASRFWPGGLVRIDPRQIVARSQVQPYPVLPSQMGLAQLLGSGAIERSGSRGFRIVRPIPRLPARMSGAHSVQLILAKGVPLPPGDPGHSCLASEGQASSLGNGRLCDRFGPPTSPPPAPPAPPIRY